MNEFSHKFCTDVVCQILIRFFPLTFKFEQKKKFEQILFGCTQPDIDEKDFSFAWHFYNPVTNTNFLGSEHHAKSRCLVHFAKFLESKDWVEFGRAIHFLEDLCTPVHVQYQDSGDAVTKLPLHMEFERGLDAYLKHKNTKKAIEEFKKFFADDFRNLSDFIDSGALIACEILQNYRKIGSNHTKLFRQTFENVIKTTLGVCSNILTTEKPVFSVKFDDVIIGYIIDGKTVAVNCDNYRLRCNKNSELMVFHKPGVGRNFVFLEKQVI